MNRPAYICWLMSLLLGAASSQAMPAYKCMKPIGSLVGAPRLSPELIRLFNEKAYPVIKANSVRLTQKYRVLRMEPEEFINEASLRILEAARTGQIDLANAKATYLTMSLEWMMSNRLRDYLQLPDEQMDRLDATYGDGPTLLEIIPDHHSEFADPDKAKRELYKRRIDLLIDTLHDNAMKRVKTEGILMPPILSRLQGSEEAWTIMQAMVKLHASKELSNRDVAMLLSYYVDHRKIQEVGAEFGVSPSRTSRIINATVKKIRLQIAAEEARPPTK